MKCGGFLPISFSDYKDEIASVLFTKGCNFKCPYCHNKSLLTIKTEKNNYESVLTFLVKRKNIITAVVICGGEPCLWEDLPDLLAKIKNLGYKTKLDTNGSFPQVLKNLINEKLLDYVAMDIKGTYEKYPLLSGGYANTSSIEQSVELLVNSPIECEFRTTVYEKFLNSNDLMQISDYIKGKRNYYLQHCSSSTLQQDYKDRGLLDFQSIKTSINKKWGNCYVR